MASVEANFIKSVLSGQGIFIGEAETSLAVPLEKRIATSQSHTSDRSFRVQQQVQLTLARKGKRISSNGSLHCSRNQQSANNTSAPGSTSGFLYNAKMCSSMGHMNGESWGAERSSGWLTSKEGTKKPSMRVEVSPPSSPQPSYFRNGTSHYGTLHRGAYTFPKCSPSTTCTPNVDRPRGAGLSHRYARSETLHSRRVKATSTRAYLRALDLQPRKLPPPDGLAFSPSGPVFVDNHWDGLIGLRQAGDDFLRGSQQSEGQALLRRIRRETSRVQQTFRQASYPPTFPISFPISYPESVVSVELDSGRKQVAAVQRVQAMQQTASEEVVQGNSEGHLTELTLEKAVSLLTQENTETQISAAQYIQHQCFTSTDARKMVFYLHGVPKLISLLKTDDEQLQTVAAGALRNVVFESSDNKMEVKDNNGILAALQLLKTSRDIEARKQLTGLLWNLSSHDQLKDYLSREAPQTLTKSVLVSCSGIYEGENPKDDLLVHPDIFYNATGCLRNMSSAGPEGRKVMRECDLLIDSLVHYIRGTIADYKPDDQSAENCVCILHNLTYQMEAELPPKYTIEIAESRQSLVTKTKTPGCFGMRSAKVLEHSEKEGPLLEEKGNPRGVEWLWSPITVRMYLSLMARSSRRYSQEAALGALQNVTSGNGMLSWAMACTIVKREGGLHHVKKMLQGEEPEVRRTAVSLLRNVSRFEELHSDIVQQVLAELIGILPGSDSSVELHMEMTISLCNILLNLCQNQAQNARAIVNHGGLKKLFRISGKDFGQSMSKDSQAASIVLQAMWRHTELHGTYKKIGYKKAAFINNRTTKAVNSVHI